MGDGRLCLQWSCGDGGDMQGAGWEGDAVKYTRLGSSDLTVSRICMGCMGFGDSTAGFHHWTLGEKESRAVMERGLEKGINFFDTAAAYQGGSSERFLGRFLADHARREEMVVATKFLPRTDEEVEGRVSGQEHVQAMLEKSLTNLGMAYVDLYIYHMWDYRTPLCEVMDGLTRVVRQGKARYVGISNCYAWQLAKANALAGAEGFVPFVSVQGHYNLIFREEEREMVPLCRHDGLAMTPYSPLAAGRLSRRPGVSSRRMEEDSYAKTKYGAGREDDAEIIARLGQVADRLSVSMTRVALAWLLGRTTAPVVGVTRGDQVDDAAAAVDLDLDLKDAAYLEEPYAPHPLVGVMADNRPV